MPKKVPRGTREQLLKDGGTRQFTFDRAKIDEENRTVPVSISSETPVKRFFGNEVLVHEKSAIDMSRAGSDRGLPLMYLHTSRGGVLVGRVHDIKLKNRRLVGMAHFSSNTRAADEAFFDVRDGFLTDVSATYDILEISENFENDDQTVKVTRWLPVEVAIEPVPADDAVGFNRNKSSVKGEGKQMPAKQKKGDQLTLDDFENARKAGFKAGVERGIEQATDGIKKIYAKFDAYLDRDGVRDLRDLCIEEGTSAERSMELLLDHLGKDVEPVTTSRQQSRSGSGPDIETTVDESDKWITGVTRALELKAGLITDKEEMRKERSANEFVAMSLQDMSRDYLIRQRVKVAGLDRMALVGQSFTRAGQFGTSDFSSVLGNVASKSMLMGWDEAPETWRTWCRVGTLSDFKVADRVNLSSFSELKELLESEEYQRGGMSDLKEQIQLVSYGRMFPISRQAIINDDLGAFTSIPRRMGRAANRKVGDIAYALLTTNPTLLQDGLQLFVAGHNNIGTVGAISETTLDEFGQLMYAQTTPSPTTDEDGARLNIEPEILLVPRNLLNAAKKVTTASIPPGETETATQRGEWQVETDARLGAASTTQYYALADPNLHDTFEIAFLDGNDEPFLDSQEGWNIDGVEYKVRIDAAGAALDYRAVARNQTA